MRYEVIKELEDKYSINLLCKAMKVAKGSYYNHILRNKNEDTLAAQKRAELTPIIEQIFHENHEIYGASKIHSADLLYCNSTVSVSAFIRIVDFLYFLSLAFVFICI